MTEGLIKHTQRRVYPVKDTESHCYGSRCQTDWPDLEICCTGTLKGFPWLDDAVWVQRWVQLCGVQEPHQATRDKRGQPCPSPVQRQHFPGGCGAPRVTFHAQYWIFCPSSQLPIFCSPRLKGFLCLTMGNLQSLWQGQGWAACRQLSLHGDPPGIIMAFHPTPSSHTPTNTHCASVRCAPGGSNQLHGTQKLPGRPL